MFIEGVIGANLSKIKLINQKKTIKNSRKLVMKFDRFLKNAQQLFSTFLRLAPIYAFIFHYKI